MNKVKLTISPDKDFVKVYKDRLDKEIIGTAKDRMLSMITDISKDGTSITALVVSPDKEAIDNFVKYLMEYYEAVVND